MLNVGCKDIGVGDCDFVAEGQKVRKVEERFFDHLREHHPEVVTGLNMEQHDDLEHRVREAIREA